MHMHPSRGYSKERNSSLSWGCFSAWTISLSPLYSVCCMSFAFEVKGKQGSWTQLWGSSFVAAFMWILEWEHKKLHTNIILILWILFALLFLSCESQCLKVIYWMNTLTSFFYHSIAGPSLVRKYRPGLAQIFSTKWGDDTLLHQYVYHCNAQTPRLIFLFRLWNSVLWKVVDIFICFLLPQLGILYFCLKLRAKT